MTFFHSYTNGRIPDSSMRSRIKHVQFFIFVIDGHHNEELYQFDWKRILVQTSAGVTSQTDSRQWSATLQ